MTLGASDTHCVLEAEAQRHRGPIVHQVFSLGDGELVSDGRFQIWVEFVGQAEGRRDEAVAIDAGRSQIDQVAAFDIHARHTTAAVDILDAVQLPQHVELAGQPAVEMHAVVQRLGCAPAMRRQVPAQDPHEVVIATLAEFLSGRQKETEHAVGVSLEDV